MTVYLVPDDPTFDAVGFSVTANEHYTATSTPTENPVEDGAIINDHIVHRRPAFTCEVTVTNAPMQSTFYEGTVRRQHSVSAPSAVGVVGSGPFSVVLSGIERRANRVQEMLERLERLRLAGATMTVLWSAGRLDAYVLSVVDIERTPNGIGKGTFHLEFKPFEVVNTETVAAPTPKEPRGSATKSKGAQPGKELTFEELLGKKPDESFAKAAGRWAASQLKVGG